MSETKKKKIIIEDDMPGMSDPGEAPTLEWVDKTLFCVDMHYQRSVEGDRSRRVINNIIKNFQWARFSPPTVTPAGDSGKYIVIDGQHRIEAARQRPDIVVVPVYILPQMTRQEAAAAFVSINKDRVNLTPIALFKAELAMGDRAALQIQEVLEEADVTIAPYPKPGGMTLPRETASIGTIRNGLKKFGEAPVIAALMIIPDTFKLTPGMMRAAALSVLMEFFYTRGVENVDRDALKRTLARKDPIKREMEARMVARDKGVKTYDALLARLNADYEKEVAQ